MGQTSSTAVDNRRQVKGGIFIQLQKTAFISNELIQGVLNISLEEPFQGHNLQVCIDGFEETHFTYQVSTGSGKNRRTRTVYAKGFNNFLNFAIPVYDFAQGSIGGAYTLQPGQWQVPFQIMVADKLPSSMNYFFNQHNRCTLKYRITASIISTEANVKPLQGSQDIFIGQQVQTLMQPVTSKKITIPVVFCCCTSGSLNLQATLDQTSYSPNEFVNVGLDCDLSAYGKTVTQMKVELRGTVIMKANNTVRQKVLVSFTKAVDVQVTGKKIQEKVQIPVPVDIPLSCTGNLIILTYNVVMTPKIDSCCCISANEPLSTRVIINPTSQQMSNLNVPQQMQIQAPQNWNPTMLQQVQFNQQQSDLFQQQQMQMQQQQQMLYQQQYGLLDVHNNNPQAVNTAQPMIMMNQNQSLL